MKLKKFELGKFYKHSGGGYKYICGIADTIIYGVGYVAESPGGEYSIVGMDEANMINWTEISKDEYLKNLYGS